MSATSNTIQSGTVLQGNSISYRILKVLGQGSFGITYLATTKITTQGSLGKMEAEVKVAIKEFFMSEVNTRRDDGSTVEGSTGNVFINYRKKFRKEAENLAKLDHPKIVKVYDVFDANNTTYYVMEYLEGESLDEYIMRRQHLSEEESLKVAKEVGTAIEYMHSKKMLHLDIKPKNIMRRQDGSYTLIDFGLSKQFNDDGDPETSTTIGLGTPGYAPIEQSQYRCEGSFPATLDVYALGATFYKMLTGQRPPEASSILNDGFPIERFKSMGISDKTIEILRKSMAPLRNDRYGDISAFLRDCPTDDNEKTHVSTIPEHNYTTNSDYPSKEVKVIENPVKAEINKPWLKYAILGGMALIALVGFLILWQLTKKSDNMETYASMQTETEIVRTSESEDTEAEEVMVTDYEWVDLGLPSGTKWATTNLGVDNVSEGNKSLTNLGRYYVWSSLKGKDNKYADFNSPTMGMSYEMLHNNGFLDGHDNLMSRYDAATAALGKGWRMPTIDEVNELLTKSRVESGTLDGRKGNWFIGPSGSRIFFPLPINSNGSNSETIRGYYLSSTVANGTDSAYGFFMDEGVSHTFVPKRDFPCLIRPVYEGNE